VLLSRRRSAMIGYRDARRRHRAQAHHAGRGLFGAPRTCSSRSRRLGGGMFTRSAPSSMVKCGFVARGDGCGCSRCRGSHP
jgi:hypothetical protein